jgi:myo-inositol-1(or 4)-monophosphatase
MSGAAFDDLHATCIAAAEAGARVLRELFDQPREVHHKGRIDLVTDADRAAEARILAVLDERAPGVRVLAEESGEHGSQGEARFIVDPLDGTTNYAHGLPLFACTVAAEVSGTVVAGCTIDPSRRELFHARRGGGAFVRRGDEQDRRLRVSGATELSQALVCTGFPYDRRERLPYLLQSFARFTELAQGTRRLGSAALDLAFVAAGRLDGFWEQGLKPWDVAAGQLLVEEAGGLVTRFDGSPHGMAGGEILAANPTLHAAMAQVLRG